MFSFTTFSSSRSCAIWSRTGAIAEHGRLALEHFLLEGLFGDVVCHGSPFLPQVSASSNAAGEAIVPARYDRLMFEPLPPVPDHPALEREILERWEREETFRKLREQNAGRPRFSFLDGPITANNPMGVHHAWGRALKDVFQRYN